MIQKIKNTIPYIRYFADPESTIRYTKALSLIKPHLKGKSSLRVVDIGGGSRSFYPEIRKTTPNLTLYSIDMVFPDYPILKEVKKVFGDDKKKLNDLKRNRKYDLVTCLDTLEHVKPKLREVFIKDLFSYNASYYLLAFPSGKYSWKQDKLLYKISSSRGFPHPYLREHVEYGLPAIDIVENLMPSDTVLLEKSWSMNLKYRLFFMKLWLKHKIIFRILSPLIVLLEMLNFSGRGSSKYRVYYLISRN